MNIHIFDYVTFSITLGMGCNAFMYHTGVNTEFNSAKFSQIQNSAKKDRKEKFFKP